MASRINEQHNDVDNLDDVEAINIDSDDEGSSEDEAQDAPAAPSNAHEDDDAQDAPAAPSNAHEDDDAQDESDEEEIEDLNFYDSQIIGNMSKFVSEDATSKRLNQQIVDLKDNYSREERETAKELRKKKIALEKNHLDEIRKLEVIKEHDREKGSVYKKLFEKTTDEYGLKIKRKVFEAIKEIEDETDNKIDAIRKKFNEDIQMLRDKREEDLKAAKNKMKAAVEIIKRKREWTDETKRQSRQKMSKRIKTNIYQKANLKPRCQYCENKYVPGIKIWMCIDNHRTCHICKPKFRDNRCGVCRDKRGYFIRDKTMEDIVKGLYF